MLPLFGYHLLWIPWLRTFVLYIYIYPNFTKTANQKVALVAAILSSKVYLEYISKNNFQHQIVKVLLQMSFEQAARCKFKTYSIFFFCIKDMRLHG